MTSTAAILATSQHWLHALAPSTGSGATGGRLVDGAVATRYWVLVDGGGTPFGCSSSWLSGWVCRRGRR